MTVDKTDQRVVMVDTPDKRRVLEHLLRGVEVSRAIVFTRTKHGADKVARQLLAGGIGAEAMHGNKSQNARQRALQKFKSGDVWVLVATDIAARGIDIDAVSHVFNYELPHEPESYVHRIGRTGRAGAAGVAWSLVDASERKRLTAVERLIGFSPPQVVVALPPREPAVESGNARPSSARRVNPVDRGESPITPRGENARSTAARRANQIPAASERRRTRRRRRRAA